MSDTFDEIAMLVRLSAPSAMIQLCNMLQWVYTSSYVGRNFGKSYLAGFSLANIIGNLFGQSIILGVLSAVETLAPQAFGSKRYKEVGLICLRGGIICFIFLLPFVPVWYNVDSILITLNQPETATIAAYHFLSIYVFGFPALIYNATVQRFYQAQNVATPLLVLSCVSLILHPLLVQICVDAYGYDGAPVAHVLSLYVAAFLTTGLLACTKNHHSETLPSDIHFSSLTWVSFKPVFRLAVPGVFSMSEWWFWELVCFFAGEFGVVELASHSIAYSLIPLCFMIPSGFQAGVSARLGILLAEQKVTLAKQVTKAAFAFCMALVFLNSFLLYVFRNGIIRLFTQDSNVMEECESIWHLVVVFILLDGLFGVQSGLCRALSHQFWMSIVIFVNLWIFGLPTIWVVAWYYEGGLLGIWMSMPAIYTVLNACMFVIWYSKDWERYSKLIQETGSVPNEPFDLSPI